MQKLVTIYLDSLAYAKGRMFVGSLADKHGLVEDHLRDELADGWSIRSVTACAGGSEGISVRGWLAVVLEKETA